MFSKEQKQKYTNILRQLAARDQNMRNRHISGKARWKQNIDNKNTELAKKIITEIGWPSAEKIGKTAEKQLWLLVQHSTDSSFQKKCLQLMKKESAQKDLVATLEDRIRTNEGKRQLYGTQFYIPRNATGDIRPRPIYDIKNLNKRRKRMGLKSFEKDLENMIKSFRKTRMYKKPL